MIYSSDYRKHFYCVSRQGKAGEKKHFYSITEIEHDPFFKTIGPTRIIALGDEDCLEASIEKYFNDSYRLYRTAYLNRHNFAKEEEMSRVYSLRKYSDRFVPVTSELAVFLFEEGKEIYEDSPDSGFHAPISRKEHLYQSIGAKKILYADGPKLSGDGSWLLDAYAKSREEADFLSYCGDSYAIYALSNPQYSYIKHLCSRSLEETENKPGICDYHFRFWAPMPLKDFDKCDFARGLLNGNLPDGYIQKNICRGDLLVVNEQGKISAYYIEPINLVQMKGFYEF